MNENRDDTAGRANARFIQREIAWFREVLDRRFKVHAGELAEPTAPPVPEPPPLPREPTPYAEVVRRFEMRPAERLILVLAYLPHVQPAALDPLFIQNKALGRRFTEFGGAPGGAHTGFSPTGETAMFLLAGDDLCARLELAPIFSAEHWFFARNVLQVRHRESGEPALAAPLSLAPEYIERLTTGKPYSPPFSAEFPARRITTPYEWSDLVLDAPTRAEVDDIVAWMRHEVTLMEGWGLKKRLKPGYRSLFYGPPGTGKTLTACLLGKATSLPVYQIDLSKVVSKYIGETEKNLAALFDHAEDKSWILFFDEADSLFGKRTESRNANDRAANQQISYLLQRIEAFPGIVILASNLKTHLDEAFSRRFQSIILFKMPSAEQRLRLWEENFQDKPYRLAKDVDLGKLARDHEISGGSIVNVLRYACLRAVARDPQEIQLYDLLAGVRRELHKEGKFTLAP